MSDKIVYRDCINWSNNDHCAKTKCNYCTKDCGDYRKLLQKPKKDALAELAEDLEEIVKDTKSDFYTTRIRKAQRIVAELATLEFFEGLDGEICPGEYTLNAVIRNCRTIAKEGANHEGK